MMKMWILFIHGYLSLFTDYTSKKILDKLEKMIKLTSILNEYISTGQLNQVEKVS